jgi:RNA polymerase sigma factor (sigma-70 family)
MDMRAEAGSTTDRSDRTPTGGYRTFEEFFEREYPGLVRALIPLAPGVDAAEEAAQDSMRRVFERWSKVAEMDSPVGYAYVTGRNSLRSRFRRAARLVFGDRDLEEVDKARDPARTVATRDRVLKALAGMSPAERDALLLVGYLGLDVNEAARALKIRPASVRSRLHRARQSAGTFIEEE